MKKNSDGGQHWERPSVARPIFRNFEIPNIKRTNDELFEFFIFIFFHIIRTLKMYDNLLDWDYESLSFLNYTILKIEIFWNF